MHQRVFKTAGELALAAADDVQHMIVENPELTVLVATGNTPMAMYEELATRVRAGRLDVSRITAVQLDEYVGIMDDQPQSLYGWMHRSFVEPLGLRPSQVVRLRGDHADPERACQEYDEHVAHLGGIDVAILGLGPNGHLGYNEPPCGPNAPTRVITLTEASVSSAGGYWDPSFPVPSHGLTCGMSTILESKNVMLLVTGEHKRSILNAALHDRPSETCPASWLQTHGCTTVYADAAAAGTLP